MNFSALFKRVSEEGITILLSVILVFLLINFNKELGIIYSIMLISDYIILKHINRVYPMERDENRFADILYGAAAYSIFLIISTLIIGFLSAQSALISPLNAVFGKLAAATPVLSDSKLLTLFGWGVLIPIIETRFFFGRLFEFLKEKFRVPGELSFSSIKTWMLFIFISAIFALFHLTARAVTSTQFDNVALIMTFVFAFISLALVTHQKELAAATHLHIINNTIGVLGKLYPSIIGAVLGIDVGGVK